jgi:hypothetical protein
MTKVGGEKEDGDIGWEQGGTTLYRQYSGGRIKEDGKGKEWGRGGVVNVG